MLNGESLNIKECYEKNEMIPIKRTSNCEPHSNYDLSREIAEIMEKIFKARESTRKHLATNEHN